MRNTVLLGLAGALLTGLLIGVQSSLSNRSGQIIGPLRTGILTNVLGGGAAFLLLLTLLAVSWIRTGRVWEIPPRQAFWMLASAGLIGILIIMGVSFSLRYTGVVAGLGTIILGQMVISAVIDSSGWLGLERIPFTWQRALGLVLMGVAVYLLLPRK